MVGVQGVGGIPDPVPERPANVRDRRRDDAARNEPKTDDLLISSEAQAAARITALLQAASKQQDDIRSEKVEAGKEALERGDHKNPQIVAQTARRISRYLP
jgi:hypothetical protein